MNQTFPDLTDVYIRIGDKGKTPLYATAGSAGCDLFAAERLVLLPGQTKVLPLDMVIALEPGVEAQIRPRSGLSLRTALRLPNSPGTIDSDYRDQVGVLLHNTFRQADLLDNILADPQVLRDLEKNYKKTTFAKWMTERDSQADQPHDMSDKNYLPDILAASNLYLDDKGNPYGTIYIQPGERIAQMVFSRHLRARFIDHAQPENFGQNRGGGFGSTGGHSDLEP